MFSFNRLYDFIGMFLLDNIYSSVFAGKILSLPTAASGNSCCSLSRITLCCSRQCNTCCIIFSLPYPWLSHALNCLSFKSRPAFFAWARRLWGSNSMSNVSILLIFNFRTNHQREVRPKVCPVIISIWQISSLIILRSREEELDLLLFTLYVFCHKFPTLKICSRNI